jgi:phage baseplate assembly protein W
MAIQQTRIHPLDKQKNVAIGITLPLTGDLSYNTIHPKSGSFAHGDESVGSRFAGGEFNQTYTSAQQAQANLRNLVYTNQGERIYHPTFGCGIYSALFENVTPSLIENLKNKIRSQVSIWLPYITLDTVEFGMDELDKNRILLRLDYNLYNNTLDPQSLVLEF